MPLTPTSAKGTVGVMIEGTSGLQTLLSPQISLATQTGISAPSGSTGMKLLVRFTNYSASGTFTISGNVSEGAISVAAPTAQQTQGGNYSFDYVTTNNFTSITNITTTGGCTGCTIAVYGIQAAKYNIPVEKFVTKRKVPKYSPNEFSGLMARDKKLIDTVNETSIDSFDSAFYGDLSLYWVYLMLGTPSVAFSTLPTSPLSVVAAATIITSMTIAAQPTAPGMKLILTFTGFTGNPSVTISGTSYGLSVSETITPTGNGTYYSSNVYSAITSIGGSTNGTTLAVTGVFGWTATFNGEQTRQTAALEHFDGSASWIHPFGYMTDGEMTISTKGDIGLTLKGMAQDKLAIGVRTTNPLQTSRVTSLGIPLGDLPLAGWQTNVYADAITGTAQTTLFTDAEEEIKITLKVPVEPHYTFNNLQTFTRAYPIKPECTVDVSYDILNLLQNEQFRQNLKQYLVVQTLGQYIGTTGGVAYQKGWTWTLPVQYDGEYGQEADVSKGNVFAKPKLRCSYDAGIGSSYQLVVVTTQPPNYTS